MNAERAFDDITGALADVFDFPKDERASPAIKKDLYTKLYYSQGTAAEKNLWLADIAKTQNMKHETAVAEYNELKKKSDKARTEKPYKPLQTKKSSPVYDRPAKDPNVETPEIVEPLKTETLKDLINRKIAPIQWIVKKILAEGLSILSGPPKIGKSLLSLCLGISISSGKRFLGEYEVERGRVLYCALEDSDSRVQARSIEMLDGADENDLALVEKTLILRKTENGGIEQIETWLKEHPDAKLIIIDTMAKVRKMPGRNSNSYLADSDFMTPLQALALAFHVAIVLVHHNRQGKEANDQLDVVSGTSGLTGVSDQIWILKRKSRKEKSATLEFIGRDFDSDEIAISMNDKLQWCYEGPAQEIQVTGERQDIVDYLSKHAPKIFTTSEIALALEKKVSAVSRLLGVLVRDEIVLPGGYGKYYIAKD